MTSRLEDVGATAQQKQDQPEATGRTLGDLLYANRARTWPPETDWVDLLAAVAGGDQGALQALYGRMHRIVFTLIVRIVNNRETAEELTVDVFHEVWRKAGGYDPNSGTVVGWIMNQARSRAIDRLRFEHRKKRTQPPGNGLDLQATMSSTEEQADAREQGRVLRTALAGLTAPEREAIETAYFCEYSYAEVAALLNQPLGTIKTRIRSGLSKLRRTLGGAIER